MKKIPFWEQKLKTLTSQEELNPPHSTPTPANTSDLIPVYMDSHYEIFMSPPDEELDNIGSGSSVIYDKRSSRICTVGIPVFACLTNEENYYIIVEDEGYRYEILHANSHKLYEVLHDYSEQRRNESEQIEIHQQNHTCLKPLRKVYPNFHIHNQLLYVTGSRPIHEYEITSPFWFYNTSSKLWKELAHKENLLNKESIWSFMLGEEIITINRKGVFSRNINEKEDILIEMFDNEKIIINPNTDSFISCRYTATTGLPSLFVLVKASVPDREHVLLEIYLHHSLKNKGSEFAVKVERYDLGIFLSFASINTNKLWEGLNDIVFMQVSEASQTSNFSSAAENFIKKSESIHKNTITTNKKVETLNFYTKATKIGVNYWSTESPTIQLNMFSVQLNLLERLEISGTNIPLSRYYQVKEYCDLVLIVEKKEIQCNRQLFEFYSQRFKKLYSNHNSRNEAQIIMKLDSSKFSSVYFLLQQLYHNLAIPVSNIDPSALIDLMILSHKFQIVEMQALCEKEVILTVDSFMKLYDYFRHSETSKFREELLKFFIIHAQDIIKLMPIGKLEELIRLVYSPDCTHQNCTEIKTKIDNSYFLKESEASETKEINKAINYAGIIKMEEICIRVCMKCHRLLGFNPETHRKNKSSVRGSSLGSYGHKKKDNSN